MISNNLDLQIENIQRELSANAREVIRIQAIMEDETRQLLNLQAQRDGESGFRIPVMNLETQAVLSYHGGKLHD